MIENLVKTDTNYIHLLSFYSQGLSHVYIYTYHRMYVLKKNLDTINLEQNIYRDDDDEFEWKYNDSY